MRRLLGWVGGGLALIGSVSAVAGTPAKAKPPGLPPMWKRWEMMVVDRETKYLPRSTDGQPSGPLRKAACLEAIIVVAPQDKVHGVMRWYADLAHPNHWYGCWPTSPIASEDFDPRDDTNK